MARINKEQLVTNALREEGLKIIGSDKSTSTEKMHWSKLLFDMQDVTKQELTVQLKQAEDAREGAETALKEAQTALDAANTELATLREQVAKVAPLEAELADLRTNFDSKIVEARKELVSSAQEHEWKAARAENAAKETLQDAQRQFGARGQQILLDFVQTLVEQFNIPEPDPSALPNGISPLVLTLWGHSAVRAQLMIAYAKSFPEPSDNFKQTLLHCLKASLPVYEGMVQPDPITDFADKVSVLTAMAAKWGVLTDIQKLLEEAQITHGDEPAFSGVVRGTAN